MKKGTMLIDVVSEKKMEQKKEEKLPEVDLELLKKSGILKLAVEANLITKQGLRMTGMGLMLGKMDRLHERIEKLEKHFYKIQSDISRYTGYKKEGSTARY